MFLFKNIHQIFWQNWSMIQSSTNFLKSVCFWWKWEPYASQWHVWGLSYYLWKSFTWRKAQRPECRPERQGSLEAGAREPTCRCVKSLHPVLSTCLASNTIEQRRNDFFLRTFRAYANYSLMTVTFLGMSLRVIPEEHIILRRTVS